jgi:uncharacterized protein YdeI (YjbR/CyaY-like superfamily)
MKVPFLKKWQEEMEALRQIALGCGLTEEKKWGKPCFTLEGKNVAIVIPLKESCALNFVKGALLKDPKGLLTKIGEHTVSGRWVKFASVGEIDAAKKDLKALLNEAVAVEVAGVPKPKRTVEVATPEELTAKFKTMPELKKAFGALTPGRQRAYLFHFSGAKQSATRASRIEKWVPAILEGKGWNE